MNERKEFFKKLRKENYTILAPDMLPIHFSLLTLILAQEGYHVKIVTPKGMGAKEAGLSAIHNDACYPLVIVAGQFIEELRSGKYDLNKTAVLISQTGGGCRASNYLALIRKAFEKEFPTVPVISLNFSGLEKDRSLPLSLPTLLKAYFAVMYGDLLMSLYNQTLPYNSKEEVDSCLKECQEYLLDKLKHGGFKKRKVCYKKIFEVFSRLYLPKERKKKVAIVGEIYVKYSPYANNELDTYLVNNGVEVVYPSFSEFILYTLYNAIVDHEKYGMHKGSIFIYNLLYKKFALRYYDELNALLKEHDYSSYESFPDVIKGGEKVISTGVKMGEGWLIPGEMVAYVEHNINNIVCVQPFGCLPNHIVGKGMIRAIKELYPSSNIAPIDFDASSTRVNQENRLKLLLTNLS